MKRVGATSASAALARTDGAAIGCRAALDFRPVEALSELDDLVFQREDAFSLEGRDREALGRRCILQSFRWHYERNPGYRAYCERVGASPATIEAGGDLRSIPLVTSTQFKLRDVVSGPPEAVVKVCTSSGTRGSISRVHRDDVTLSRFLGSVQASIDRFLRLDDALCLHLGPSKEEAGDLWFSYVMAATDVLYPTENFVDRGRFDAPGLVERLRAEREEFESIVLIGAPILFTELVAYVKKAGVRIECCDRMTVVTAGGWKRFSGIAIRRAQFDEELRSSFLGLRSENIRDFFNMVELNTVFAECEFRTKHVPPWVSVDVLNPVTLAPAAPGEVGLLAFLDPTPTSYPGFVLTDDLATISARDDCSCGRKGLGIEFVRRVHSVESRGCALKMDRARSERARETDAGLEQD